MCHQLLCLSTILPIDLCAFDEPSVLLTSMPIDYQISCICLSTILPIDHHAHQPSCPGLSAASMHFFNWWCYRRVCISLNYCTYWPLRCVMCHESLCHIKNNVPHIYRKYYLKKFSRFSIFEVDSAHFEGTNLENFFTEYLLYMCGKLFLMWQCDLWHMTHLSKEGE